MLKRRENILEKVYDFSVETHHILPRSCGGTNDKTNLINLTPREHYIAHLLLVKIALLNNNDKMLQKMICAVYFLINGRRHKINGMRMNSKLYELLRLRQTPTWIGRHHTDELRMKTRLTMIKNGIKGRRTWLHKDNIVKYVLNSKVEQFLKNGWTHGRPGYKPRKGMHGKTI